MASKTKSRLIFISVALIEIEVFAYSKTFWTEGQGQIRLLKYNKKLSKILCNYFWGGSVPLYCTHLFAATAILLQIQGLTNLDK